MKPGISPPLRNNSNKNLRAFVSGGDHTESKKLPGSLFHIQAKPIGPADESQHDASPCKPSPGSGNSKLDAEKRKQLSDTICRERRLNQAATAIVEKVGPLPHIPVHLSAHGESWCPSRRKQLQTPRAAMIYNPQRARTGCDQKRGIDRICRRYLLMKMDLSPAPVAEDCSLVNSQNTAVITAGIIDM